MLNTVQEISGSNPIDEDRPLTLDELKEHMDLWENEKLARIEADYLEQRNRYLETDNEKNWTHAAENYDQLMESKHS